MRKGTRNYGFSFDHETEDFDCQMSDSTTEMLVG